MDLNLTNKHVLIGGGSKGIGFASANGFLQEGARVSIIGRNTEHLTQCYDLLMQSHPTATVSIYSIDLKDSVLTEKTINNIEQQNGPIDILVNCASSAKEASVLGLTVDDFEDAMQSKFFTYINLIMPVIKRMALNKSGSIVNVLGSGGKVANPESIPRGAASSALMLVSAGLASAYGPFGVRVNVINPGSTLTFYGNSTLSVSERKTKATKQLATQLLPTAPLGRMALPDEIANAVLFVSSPMASYITGAVLDMDGAMTPMIC